MSAPGVRTPQGAAEAFETDTLLLRVLTNTAGRAYAQNGPGRWLEAADPTGTIRGDGDALLFCLLVKWREAADTAHEALVSALAEIPAGVRTTLANAALDLQADAAALRELYDLLPPDVRSAPRAMTLYRAHGHSFLHSQALAGLAGAEAMECAMAARERFRASMDQFTTSAPFTRAEAA